MAKAVRNGYLLYHLTALDNLENILKEGLLPRNKIRKFTNVANSEIIEFRARTGLNDYVPFHFFAKNPFDGRVQKDYPDIEFIYICVYRTYARKNGFKILTMHPIALGEDFVLYDYDEGFNEIDWTTMELDDRDYRDPYCRHVCMAECLCGFTIKPEDFGVIFVKNEGTISYVKNMCNEILGFVPFKVYFNRNLFTG